MGSVECTCLNRRLGCHGSRAHMEYAARASFWTFAGSPLSSLLNWLLVCEITIYVERACFARFEFAERFAGHFRERALG
jgi:hypothetical protein